MSKKEAWFDKVLQKDRDRVVAETMTIIKRKKWHEGQLALLESPYRYGRLLIYFPLSRETAFVCTSDYLPSWPMPRDNDDIIALEWEEVETGKRAIVLEGIPVLPRHKNAIATVFYGHARWRKGYFASTPIGNGKERLVYFTGKIDPFDAPELFASPAPWPPFAPFPSSVEEVEALEWFHVPSNKDAIVVNGVPTLPEK